MAEHDCHWSTVDAIWGALSKPEEADARIRRLTSVLRYYEDERQFGKASQGEIIASILLLKESPTLPKDQYQCATNSPSTNKAPDTPCLDLAVRLAFVTACSRPAFNEGGGSIFRPRWKDNESLEAFLSRVFPLLQAPQQDLASFSPRKLCASYLNAYASIQLRWTNHLSDHLMLLKGDDWKSLYIFKHPGFLKVSLDTLAVHDENLTQKPADALKLGCLPSGLLKETLMTLDILFPVIGNSASRVILEREVDQGGLDPYFLDRFYLDAQDHERPGDAWDPRDVRSLYEKYPYWADRLYDLWREADDPTPITRIERWTESRRNPRFTYWCTVVSIIAVLIFGLCATGLGAVQVWMTYCSWVDDPSRPQSGYKSHSGSES